VRRPLRDALHLLSVFARKKTFSQRVNWETFSFGCAGPTDEHCPLFFGPCVVIFLAPRRRETHVLFFPRKVL
jgi:hypothetical protein